MANAVRSIETDSMALCLGSLDTAVEHSVGIGSIVLARNQSHRA